MSNYITKFESVLDVVVVDRNGKPTGEMRTFASPSWSHYFKGEPVVVVNWLFDGAERPTEEDLKKPFTYKGQQYTAYWAWGSAIKKGYTIGMTHDILRDTKLGAKAEDGQRAGRAFLPNALYGAAIGNLRIYLAEKGEIINGLPVGDGFGYTAMSMFDKVRNLRSPIQLGQVRDSFHMAQRLKWTSELAEETVPLLHERLILMSDPIKWLKESHMKADEKLALVEMNPEMEMHPYIANSLTRSSQEVATRLATSIPMGGMYRVAVPTTASSITANGKYIVGRYPMDSNSSERAVTAQCEQAEIERVHDMEVAQYTILSKSFFAKGNTGRVADEKLVIGGQQYDVILCKDDIKMAVEGVDHLRKQSSIEAEDIYVGYTQCWGKGSSIGVNYERWAAMGGDFDGDGAVIVNCEDRPALWNAVNALPEGATYKLPKTKSTWDKGDMRPNMILKSLQCAVIVGWATNIAATTFAVEDREWLAKQLGYTNGSEALDRKLNNLIKIGTDGFKATVDTAEAEKDCALLQSALVKVLSKGAPWCSWHRDAMAFKHMVPDFAHEGMSKDEMRISIPPMMDGVVSEIARITLPNIRNFLTIQIEAKPLTAFINWADDVPTGLYEEAEKLQIIYNGRVKSTNFSDENAVDNFSAWWDTTIQAWIDSHPEIGRAKFAAALWRVAHSSRSANAGGGSIFTATPLKAEVHEIVAHPGQVKGGEIVLTGLQFNVPVTKLDHLECEVKVIDWKWMSHGKATVRKIITAAIDGQLPSTQDMPEGTLAMVSTNSAQPVNGEYKAVIHRASEKSWNCVLEPVK